MDGAWGSRLNQAISIRHRIVGPAGVVVGLLATCFSAAAQEMDHGGSGWPGPWHASIGLAARMSSDSVAMADVLAAAESELALGRPESALELLSRHLLPDSMGEGAPLAVYAASQYAVGSFLEAGSVFDLAANHATGLRRGTLRARAARSFERASVLGRAAELYRKAASDFPDVAGWMALREAAIIRDEARALELLGLVPEAARQLAAAVRAGWLQRAGDDAGASEVLADVGQYAAAGLLARNAGEDERARELIYQAVAVRESEQALSGVETALSDFPPTNADEHTAIARAILRYGRPAEAVSHSAAAVVASDSVLAALLFHGEATEASGNRRGALPIYEGAAKRDGDEAAEASYRFARTYVRLRQRTRAAQALGAFLDAYPEHPRAPAATFLLGGIRQDQRRVREADSIFRALHQRWPADRFASDARSRLGARALARGDIDAATAVFRAEVEQSGSRSRAAQYQIARLARDAGDTATALEEWTTLARRDSIGYYGTMARHAAGLPDPVFAPKPTTVPSARVEKELAVLDLLRAAELNDEAAALMSHLGDPDHWEVVELMDVAEGLIARGQARSAVAVGWRIAGLHRLNDPRVLRIIFPWPNRDLIEREAAEFNLDPFLLAALVRQESAFDADATSRAGARGMMQLMPATARGLARQLRVDWNNTFLGVADANVHLGAAHLAQILKQYDDELVLALAAYNAGGSRVRRWRRFPEAQAGDWFLFTERIPFAETRGYVQTLIRNRDLYRALYGESIHP